jgi:uncharacterized membrane protein YphA (DoxX/SURF4 family)
MFRTNKNRWQWALLQAGRVAVGVVLVYAAYGKLKPQLAGFGWSINSIELSLAVFAATIDSYRILPPWAVTAAASWLPFIESVLGIWLITGIARRFSSLLSSALFATFFTAMLSVYLRHIKVPCGCDLIPGEQIGPLSLTIDLLLCSISGAVSICEFRLWQIRSVSGAFSPNPGRAIA